MNLKEYKQKYTTDDAPGWLAIDEKLSEVYKGQKERHHGPLCGVHYQVGGTDPIDGTSIYDVKSPEFHRHIISYGLSELYYNEEKVGQEFSAWGFEFTFRLKQKPKEKDGSWYINLMNNLARYVFKSGRWFEPFHILPGNDPIKLESQTKLTSLIFIVDPILGIIQTPHGEVTFLQIVGITDKEADRIKNSNDIIEEVKTIINEMKIDNPLLITDLNRTKEYL